MTGRIHLANMAFYGYHGHHPEENIRGQRFLLDLVLTVDISEAADHDRLSATVDYGKVYALVRRIVEHDRVKLLETLCQRILQAVLSEFPRVERAELVIKKPSAPIPGVLDYVAIEAAADRADRVPGPGR